MEQLSSFTTFDEGGITLLWLIVHHRLSLRNNTNEDNKSELWTTFKLQNVLTNYEGLSSFNVQNWPTRKRYPIDDDSFEEERKKTKSSSPQIN